MRNSPFNQIRERMLLREQIFYLLKSIGVNQKVLFTLNTHVTDLCSLLKYGDPHFFRAVAIETQSECNRSCAYCPVSRYPHPKGTMSDELFKKIVADLKSLRFSGCIDYCFYSEPLLDLRLPGFMEYAKHELPNTMHRLATNGDYLSPELLERLIRAGMTYAHATNHSNSAKRQEFLEALAAKYPGRLMVRMGKDLEPELSSRGGLLADLKEAIIPMKRCTAQYPVITFNGDVLLCCVDYRRRYVFGNLSHESLLAVWRKKEFADLRREIRSKQYRIEMCRRCRQVAE